MSIRRVCFALASVLMFSPPAVTQQTLQPIAAPVGVCAQLSENEKKLEDGQVLVDCKDIDGIKYVVGRIWIDQTPEELWGTMTNPFEFRQHICKRMKKVEVLTDEPAVSVLSCTIGAVFPIPDFQYIVESRYVNNWRVEFHRLSGSFKDFRGFWEIKPVANGSKSEVTYSMYIDPGFPAPDWLVRMAVRCELPNVLTGLRQRSYFLKTNPEAAEKLTLKAAAIAVSAQPTAKPLP